MIHDFWSDLTEGMNVFDTLGVGGFLSAITVAFFWLKRKAWPTVRKVVALTNAFLGEDPATVPPGEERRLGVLDRLAKHDELLETVLEEAQRGVRVAEGARGAAEIAARQAGDSAALTRKVSELAAQAAVNAREAATDASAAKALAESVSQQLSADGGSTLRDAIDRVETRLSEHLDSVRHEANPDT